jgi:hypothetical protein
VAVPDTTGEITWREGLAVLDEELSRLPVSYRSALILCYLEGRRQDEAARELGCSLGVLCGRLVRARECLRKRMVRRGVAWPSLRRWLGPYWFRRMPEPRCPQPWPFGRSERRPPSSADKRSPASSPPR